jgi:hypothetical protein
MSLSGWEQQSLDSIKDGLTGSDPELTALLITFTRLTAGEQMPVRATPRARSRRAIQRSRRQARRGRDRDRGRAGQAGQRPRSRHAVLTCLLVTMVMIGAALALSRGDGQAACSGSVFGPACANRAPASGAPFAGQAAPAGYLPG